MAGNGMEEARMLAGNDAPGEAFAPVDESGEMVRSRFLEFLREFKLTAPAPVEDEDGNVIEVDDDEQDLYHYKVSKAEGWVLLVLLSFLSFLSFSRKEKQIESHPLFCPHPYRFSLPFLLSLSTGSARVNGQPRWSNSLRELRSPCRVRLRAPRSS
jgi:hypothetical protein